MAAFREHAAVGSQQLKVLIANHGRSDVVSLDYHHFMADPARAGGEIFNACGLGNEELPTCLQMMNDKRLERVSGVVGETIVGGRTQLNLREKANVYRICTRTEVRWQKSSRQKGSGGDSTFHRV